MIWTLVLPIFCLFAGVLIGMFVMALAAAAKRDEEIVAYLKGYEDAKRRYEVRQ